MSSSAAAHRGRIECIACSDELVLTGSEDSVCVWDLDTRHLLACHEGLGREARALAWVPCQLNRAGSRAAGEESIVGRVLAHDRLLKTLRCTQETGGIGRRPGGDVDGDGTAPPKSVGVRMHYVAPAAWPFRQRFAARSSCKAAHVVQVFDVSKGVGAVGGPVVMAELEGPSRDTLEHVVLSASGNVCVVAYADLSLAVFSTVSGALLGRLLGHTCEIQEVKVVELSGTVLSAAWDDVVRVWNLGR